MIEQWQELKETIIELRDGDGTGTQQETCKFLTNYMDVLEKNVGGSEVPMDSELIARGDILDKIRAEIEELDVKYLIGDYAIYGENIPKYVRLWDVLQIIDKYKAESEE